MISSSSSSCTSPVTPATQGTRRPTGCREKEQRCLSSSRRMMKEVITIKELCCRTDHMLLSCFGGLFVFFLGGRAGWLFLFLHRRLFLCLRQKSFNLSVFFLSNVADNLFLLSIKSSSCDHGNSVSWCSSMKSKSDSERIWGEESRAEEGGDGWEWRGGNRNTARWGQETGSRNKSESVRRDPRGVVQFAVVITQAACSTTVHPAGGALCHHHHHHHQSHTPRYSGLYKDQVRCDWLAL